MFQKNKENQKMEEEIPPDWTYQENADRQYIMSDPDNL